MGYTPPYLEVRKVAGAYNIYPPSSTTTDDLTIFPNTTDSTPYITLFGTSSVRIAASSTQLYSPTVKFLEFSYATPDVIIENPIDTKNIYLKTTGTGNVKFGTYTAGAATDSTGYITILDAAGNPRKLMVQA